jgi:AraC-like DNA-binding protein
MDMARILSIREGGAQADIPLIRFENIRDSIQFNSQNYRQYPDGSRSLEDLVNMICFITTAAKPVNTVVSGFLLGRNAGVCHLSFSDGAVSPPHTHNYNELAYIAEGSLCQNIEGRDIRFNQGEICLLDKNTRHADYLYQKNMAVLFLGIGNRFFDKSLSPDSADDRTKQFLYDTMLRRKEKNGFLRFVPQNTGSEIPGFFEKILTELLLPRPGSVHLVLGYVERLLSLLPGDYRAITEGGGAGARRQARFDEVRTYLEEHYRDVSMGKLTGTFGHTIDYFNRLIKRHTGMTYSRFLQNIRLEKAWILLRTTAFPVEEVARRVGYENVGYFYKIFTEKYGQKPNESRRVKQPGPL